jgi:hypothetical protein
MRLPFYGIAWVMVSLILFWLLGGECLKLKREKIWLFCYAVLLSLSIVMGYHLNINLSNLYSGTIAENYVTHYSAKNIVVFIILIPIYYNIINRIVDYSESRFMEIRFETVATNNGRYSYWIFATVLIFLLWIPYFMVYFPGFIFGDSRNSILQAFGEQQWSNHFPVLYSYFIKICLDIGFLFGDAGNIGCAIYTMIQMIYISVCLGYTVSWLFNKGVSRKICLFLAAFYGLVPFFATNSIAMWKDPMFSATICVWTLLIWDFVSSDTKIFDGKFAVKNIIIMLIICFLRNNGVYIMAFADLVLILLAIAKRKEIYADKLKKSIIVVTLVIVFVKFVTGPVYNSIGIAEEPIEKVGIFLNQMASVAAYDGNMSDADKEFMNNLLPLDMYKDTYRPCVVDMLKWDSEFNTEYFNEHTGEFWKTYVSMFVKNPYLYLKAYELNTFGYWAINYWELNFDRGNISSGYTNAIYYLDGYGIYPENLMEKYISNAESIFVSNDSIISLAVLNWLVLLLCVLCISKRKYMYLLVLAPSVGLMATLMIGTPHAYWQRYGLACCYLIPFYIFAFVNIVKREKNSMCQAM